MATKKYASYADFTNGQFSEKLFLFQLSKRKDNPTMTRSDGTPMVYPARAPIMLFDTIFDKAKNQRREIRFVPGAKSIFVDEQTGIDVKNKQYQHVFKDGISIVDGTNPLLVEFLMKCNYNGHNPNRDTTKKLQFNFVDKGSDYKNAIEKDKKEQIATNWCYDTKIGDVVAYARVLIGDRVTTMDDEEIRWTMKSFAKSNPAKFLADLNNPKTKRKHVVLESIDKGLLKINVGNNSISWAENVDLPLATAPVGVDVVDHFVQATFTQDGEAIYEALKEQVAPKVASAAILNTFIPSFKKLEPVTTVEAPQLHVNDVKWSELKAMYESALAKGLITKKSSWIKYGDFSMQGDDTKFIKMLKGDKVLYEKLVKDLQEEPVI